MGEPMPEPEPELPVEPRDPLDATAEIFTEVDADARGWIVCFTPPDENGARRYHRVPVAAWAAYERAHGL